MSKIRKVAQALTLSFLFPLSLFHSALSLADNSPTQTPTIPLNELKGDAEKGKFIFGKCRTCHFIEPYLGHYNGPSLYNIFGNKVGSQDFEYSEALKQANFEWTPEILYFWLSNPETFLPNSQMVFAGFTNDQDKADLIAYMMLFSKPVIKE